MNHAEVRDHLELAAVEPGGLDRLMAGDTLEAAAIATHLAGCPACLEELGRLRRSSTILRDIIATRPPAELRDRTLAFVRELGVQRGAATTMSPENAFEPTVEAPRSRTVPVGATDDSVEPGATIERGVLGDLEARRRRLAGGPRRAVWIASIAAAVVLSVIGTSLYLGSRADEDATALAKVASWTVDLALEPDIHRVVLASTTNGAPPPVGELSYSPSSKDLVVVARGLAPAPANMEYRCWLESPTGTRTRIGKMSLAYGIFYWVGDVPELTALSPGTRFGVSLADVSGTGPDQPALIGQL